MKNQVLPFVENRYITNSFLTKKLLPIFISVLLFGQNLLAQDLGPSAYSKLTWDHISTVHSWGGEVSTSIGLTTDKKMYLWGNNKNFTIHKNYVNNGPTIFYPLHQMAPFYLPSPAGETIKKVQVKSSKHITLGDEAPTYFCLSESGKLFAWGYNNGLLATAWPVPSSSPANTLADTTRNKRAPVQLTILGESTFVDFDASSFNDFWIAIGASGKAYHIGKSGIVSGGGIETNYNFAALPNPDGVDNATFKYTKAWTYKNATQFAFLYLKGNNGKIYWTGGQGGLYAAGIPSQYEAPTPTDINKFYGKIRIISPLEVAMPAGVDVVDMEVANPKQPRQTTTALGADGKVYMTGLWRVKSTMDNYWARNYVVVPLKTAPASTDVSAVYSNTWQDSTYTLKSFVEIAMPPGATKILDITSHDKESAVSGSHGFSVVGDNNKVYWSGVIPNTTQEIIIYASNYLSLAPVGTSMANDRCIYVNQTNTLSQYSWSEESINLEGASQLFASDNIGASNGFYQMGIISKTGRGYFFGNIQANTGLGKISSGSGGQFGYTVYPVPIANEQLLSCQASPGTGGSWAGGGSGVTNTAVGTIDCSKTQIITAPQVGVIKDHSIVVTLNVTTAGGITPITVTGSGMTVAPSFSLSTATTGIQQFTIPVHYDGTALGSLDFTVGTMGSCTANLGSTTNNTKTVNMEIWTLDNCTLKPAAPKLK